MDGAARVKRQRKAGATLRTELVVSVPGHVIAATPALTLYTDGYQVILKTAGTTVVVHGGPASSVFVAADGDRAVIAADTCVVLYRSTDLVARVMLAQPVTAVAVSADHFAATSAAELCIDGVIAPAARRYSAIVFAGPTELVASAACNVYSLAAGLPERPLFGTGGEAVLAMAAAHDRVAVAISDAVLVVHRGGAASFTVPGAWTGVGFHGPYLVCAGLESRRLLYTTSGTGGLEAILPVLTCLLPDADGAAGLCVGSNGVVHSFGNDVFAASVFE